jgi:hypothetical protein
MRADEGIDGLPAAATNTRVSISDGQQARAFHCEHERQEGQNALRVALSRTPIASKTRSQTV